VAVLFDYFVAPSDAAAAATLDRTNGPRTAEPAKRGLFGRRRDVELAAYRTVSTGIDPVVQAGTLEEILTGRDYDELKSNPKWGKSLAIRNEGERLVLTITDTLIAALADASDDRLAAVAIPWSQTEEFWGMGDPSVLAKLLRDLAELARAARDDQHSVYCWVCV
jgi:hypothetical protein